MTNDEPIHQTPDPDRVCPHEDIHTHLDLVLLQDTGKRQADIRLWCNTCEEPFLWPESLPIGVNLSGVARSLDGQELRIAVRSSADVLDMGPGITDLDGATMSLTEWVDQAKARDAEPGLLTDREHEVMDLTAQIANQIGHVVAHGPAWEQDVAELVVHIHGIQRTILSQAAARAYPSRYRLLGQTLLGGEHG